MGFILNIILFLLTGLLIGILIAIPIILVWFWLKTRKIKRNIPETIYKEVEDEKAKLNQLRRRKQELKSSDFSLPRAAEPSERASIPPIPDRDSRSDKKRTKRIEQIRRKLRRR